MRRFLINELRVKMRKSNGWLEISASEMLESDTVRGNNFDLSSQSPVMNI